MSGIKGFSSSLKNIKPPKAYPNAKTEQQFATITPTGYDKHGLDVVLKAHYPLGLATAIDAIQPSEDADRIIFLTGHGLRKGDIVRFATGSSLEGIESEILEIPDANTMVLATKLPSVPVAGVDTIELLRGVTLKTAADGTLQASSGPLEWVLNSASQQLIEDTVTPANNRFVPVGMAFQRDGVATRVIKDTVTPSNTIPLPVELVSVDGIEATFNVSTGDLNVAMSHDGVAAAFDSVRIGDGTNLAQVDADLRLQVRDELSRALLASIDGKDFATQTTLDALLTELQLKADLTETQPVSAASLPLPTGAATQSTLADLLTELQLKADLTETQPVSAASLPLPTGAATQSTLADLLTELQLKADLTETQPVSAASLPLPTGAATQSTLADLLTELQLKADLTETQPVSAASLPLPTGAATELTLGEVNAKLPATLGQKTKAASLAVTLASDEDPIETKTLANDGLLISRALTLAATAITLSAPANANKVFLQAASTNLQPIFIGFNGLLDDTNGWELLPGASVEFETGVDVTYYSTVGSERLNYIWTTRS